KATRGDRTGSRVRARPPGFRLAPIVHDMAPSSKHLFEAILHSVARDEGLPARGDGPLACCIVAVNPGLRDAGCGRAEDRWCKVSPKKACKFSPKVTTPSGSHSQVRCAICSRPTIQQRKVLVTGWES